MGRIMKSRIRSWGLAVLCAALCSGPAAAQTANRSGGGMRMDDEALMQPTRLGLRLTPEIARGAARAWVSNELHRRLDLDEQQRARMAELVSRRVMDMGHRNPEQLQGFAELFLESAISGGPARAQWSSEDGQDFAERAEPLIPEFRNLFDGLIEDFRPILDERQMTRLRNEMDNAKRGLDAFETRMERWRRGEIREGENPFRGPRGSRDEIDSDDPEVIRQHQRERTLRRAERRADQTLANYGPRAWEQFFHGARDFFNFDERQTAVGQRLLADYGEQYRNVMTEELKERIGRNRLAWELRFRLGDEPCEPWIHRLERDFQEMIQPISDLGEECIDAILALATPEQRRAAVEAVQDTAAEHGLPPEAIDMEALGLTER